MSSKKVLGIDLGTTNSCVAVIDGGAPKVLENLEGRRTTPSVVAFSSTGQTFIGDAAKRQAHANTLRTIYSAKRIIGKKFDDIQHIINKLPYKIVKGPNGEALINIDSKTHSPSYISGLLLSHLVKDACQHLGMQIKDVVITVPAHFNDAQRQATKDAGEIAGLNVLRIINEPTAAAMAYGMDKITSGKILVFDLGGGTFDATLLDIMDGLFRVITTDGDTELGGEDFDNAIMSHVLEDFKKKEGIDLSKDGVALYRIKEASEEAKKELSRQTQTTVSVPFIAPGPKNISCVITRPFFESLINSYVDRAISLTSKMIAAANINISEIDRIVCVGGSTRIPMVRERLQKFAGKNISFDINPDEAVAIGASIQGGILVGEVSDVVLLDVTPLSLGIESMGGAFAKIIEKNTQIPTSKSKIFTTTMDNQSTAQIVIYQGERPMVRDNKKLGEFELVGIKQTQRGEPQIEVTFHIDANGIMKVSAKDLANNSEQKIVLHPDTGLSKEEIAKMIKDAEEQKQKDEEEFKKVEINNQLELNNYSIEKLLSDNKDKLPESEFSEFESRFSEIKVMQDKEVALEQSKTLLQNIQSKIPSDQPKTE